MLRKLWFILLLGTCVFFNLPSALFAQSNTTKSGLNGALFDVYTSFDIENILKNCGGRLGYSISGILDIGMDFDIQRGKIEGTNSTETNIGIRYGVMLLKQEELAPFSLEIGGSYGYSLIECGYYNDEGLQEEGAGYKLHTRILRDYQIDKASQFRIGIIGSVRNYNYTTERIALAAEEAQLYSIERQIDFQYGLIGAYTKTTGKGSTYCIGLEPLMDENLNFFANLRAGLIFEIR